MELNDYLRILRAHWLAIGLLVLLGVGAASGWSLLQPRLYTANSSATVSVPGTSDLGSALAADNLARSRVGSYLEYGQSRAVAQYAIEALELELSPAALVRQVSVSNPSNTTVIHVSATASTPEGARDLAEAWIAGMAAEVTQQETSGGAGAPAITLVPIDSAQLPSSPSSPNVRLALALGALIGLAGGVAYAVLRTVLDRRIRNAETIEREFELPVIGTIPVSKAITDSEHIASTSSVSGLAAPDVAIAESMRELRTNLQFMDVDNPPRILVMTSPLPGDGKSTTTANLAVTLAENGQRVVVVDGDLRRPRIAEYFGLIPGIGVTDVLVGRAELHEVVQPYGRNKRLSILGAGQIPPNPSELLGSLAMGAVLQDLARDAIVLIDAPPLIPVTDAAILTAKTDGALIVVSAGSTTKDQLADAIGTLGRVNGRTLGIILNRIPRRGPDSTKYGYRYAGYYSSDAAETDESEDWQTPEPLRRS